MTTKDRRRAQLDALKVMRLTQSGRATLAEALEMAVPMVQSKPTKYTRVRRNRARIEVQKAQKARVYADEYEKQTIRKPKKRLTENEKTRRRARRMLEAMGRRGHLNERQKKAIASGYSAKEVIKGWAPAGSKTWKSRRTTLARRYNIPVGYAIDDYASELEYRTAQEVARRHGLKEKPKGTPDKEPILWQTFTKVGPLPLEWERLKRGYGAYITNCDIEDGSKGHKSGYIIYMAELYQEPDLMEVEEKGKFKSLAEARESLLEHAYGDAYIYVEYAEGLGKVYKRDEYMSAVALHPGWWHNDQYTTDPRGESYPDAESPFTYITGESENEQNDA